MKRATVIALVLIVLAPLGCSLSLPSLGPIAPGDYFVTDAEIDGHRVSLVVDTGAEFSVLFRQTAIRLGLKVTEWASHRPLEPGRVGIGMAEECTITLWGKTAQQSPCSPRADSPSPRWGEGRVRGFAART